MKKGANWKNVVFESYALASSIKEAIEYRERLIWTEKEKH